MALAKRPRNAEDGSLSWSRSNNPNRELLESVVQSYRWCSALRNSDTNDALGRSPVLSAKCPLLGLFLARLGPLLGRFQSQTWHRFPQWARLFWYNTGKDAPACLCRLCRSRACFSRHIIHVRFPLRKTPRYRAASCFRQTLLRLCLCRPLILEPAFEKTGRSPSQTFSRKVVNHRPTAFFRP